MDGLGNGLKCVFLVQVEMNRDRLTDPIQIVDHLFMNA